MATPGRPLDAATVQKLRRLTSPLRMARPLSRRAAARECGVAKRTADKYVVKGGASGDGRPA